MTGDGGRHLAPILKGGGRRVQTKRGEKRGVLPGFGGGRFLTEPTSHISGGDGQNTCSMVMLGRWNKKNLKTQKKKKKGMGTACGFAGKKKKRLM